MSSLYEAKQFAFDWVNENEQRLSDFDMEIWRYAEPAWREYRSAKAYVDLLRDEGFEVEVGSGEMPTAFLATWGTRGPVIGSYAEYDAVPGNSQQPVPYQAPREGLHPYAAGHTDPHSMLASPRASPAKTERRNVSRRCVAQVCATRSDIARRS